MAIVMHSEPLPEALAGMDLGAASDVLADLARAEKLLVDARAEFDALGKRWPKDLTTYTVDGAVKILTAVLKMGNEMELLWSHITAPGEPSALAKYLRERRDYEFALKRLKLLREETTWKYSVDFDSPTNLTNARQQGLETIELPKFRYDMGRFLRGQLNELEKLTAAAKSSGAGFARSWDRFYGAGQKFIGGVADVASTAWDATKAIAGGVADAAVGVGGLLKYLPYALVGGGALFVTSQLRRQRAGAGAEGLGGVLQDYPGIPSAVASVLGWTSSRAVNRFFGEKNYGALAKLAAGGVSGYLVGYGYAKAVDTPPDTGAMAGAIGGLYDVAVGDLVPKKVAIPVAAALGWFGAEPAANLLLGEG